MKPKYDLVHLTNADRKAIKQATGKGACSNQTKTRASILLALDENSGPVKDQEEIAAVLKCSTATIRRTAKAFCEGGVDKVLDRKKRTKPPVAPKATGDVEAKVIKMACSSPPEGRARWTLRLMENTIAITEDMPNLSYVTIDRILKKHHLSLT